MIWYCIRLPRLLSAAPPGNCSPDCTQPSDLTSRTSADQTVSPSSNMSPPNFTRTLFLHATRGPASPLARNLSLRIPRLSSSVQYFSSSPFSRPPIHLNQTVPLHRLQHHSLSTMSSAPAKKEFLCIVPDKPGAIAKRIEVRPYVLSSWFCDSTAHAYEDDDL